MLTIALFSDLVCPWCWIGKRRLERVLAAHPDLVVTRVWRPFRLRPDLPPEGEDWAHVIAHKFGGAERARAMFARVAEAGASEGITFGFDRITRAPNTQEAHRLVLAAADAGDPWPLVERLHAAYFTEGRDIGEPATLRALALEVGLDAARVASVLDGDAHRGAVAASEREAAELGVSGVPFFVFGDRFAVSGAQPVGVFEDVLRRMREAP
jgi:predicted DsbA family dithiol-disulfide isomerase